MNGKFLTAAFCVALLAGCGDESTTVNETTGISQLAKGESLPGCSESNAGEMLFAADSGLVYYCANGEWQTLNGKDGADGKDGSDGSDGTSGESCEAVALEDGSGYKILCGKDSVGVVKSGADGSDGKSSVDTLIVSDTLVLSKLDTLLLSKIDTVVVSKRDTLVVKDTTVLSNVDTLFVKDTLIISNVDILVRIDTVLGLNGAGCSASDDGDGTVKVICGQDTALLYRALCGSTPFEPTKKFCSEGKLYSCGNLPFNPVESFCYTGGSKDSIVALCGGDVYDLDTGFCSNGQIFSCGKKPYDPTESFCFNDGSKDSIVALCGGDIYDLDTGFCSNGQIFSCGKKPYDPTESFCFNDGSKDSTVALCNGKSYDVISKYCLEGEAVVAQVPTTYLNQEMLAAGEYGILLDVRDSQVYRTVEIGSQVWMAQNLNYRYTQGTASLDSMSFCYENKADSCVKYGRLYTWSATMDSLAEFSDNGKDCGYNVECLATHPVRGICPEGWHLPDTAEWSAFEKYVDANNGSEGVGTSICAKKGWRGNYNGSDLFGWSALGHDDNIYRSPPTFGWDNMCSENAFFWSSTSKSKSLAYHRRLIQRNFYSTFNLSGYKNTQAKSVRCLKDSE